MKQSRFWRFLKRPSWYLWLLPALLAFGGQRFLAANPQLTERYFSRNIFRWLSVPIGFLTSLLPFSLTEILVIAGLPLLLALVVFWIVRMVRGPERVTVLGRSARVLAWVFSGLYLLFMLLHGFNYARLPVAASFSLPVRERSAAELAATTSWLAGMTVELRQTRSEDGNGVFTLAMGTAETLKAASAGFTAAAAEKPLLAGIDIRPKGVLLSRYWSYTGITGMYFPFLVEANVNIDVMPSQIPAVALHEIAHTRGFAREDEADFLAFFTGIHHPHADFAYSVFLNTTVRCLNFLYSADRDAYDEAVQILSEDVRRDLQANSSYWRQFEGPVREVSTQVNHAYLQANLQQDGVRSYGRMVDLVLAWYEAMNEQGRLQEISSEILERAGY